MSPGILWVIAVGVCLTAPRLLHRRAADCLGSVTVLMFTTAGPTCLVILENSLDIMTGFGTVSGRASEESTACSLPLTRAGHDGTGDDAERKGRK